MKYIIITLSVIFIVSSTLVGIPIDDYKIMTEEFPPYNYKSETGKPAGLFVELLMLILKEMGSDKTEDDIYFYPWARSYRLIVNNPKMILFATTISKERSELFRWAGPKVRVKIGLTALKDKHIKIKSAGELSSYKIGVIRDDIGEQLLKTADFPNNLTIREYPKVIQIIKNLNIDRVNLWSFNLTAAYWFLKKFDDPELYETVFTISENKFLTFAFSYDTPDSLINNFQGAWERVQKNNEINVIMEKYGLKPDDII